MRKPLYLDIAQAKTVSLEAVALRVIAHEQAEHFYPLRRISRVIVTGKVRWETDALLACLEYGIPVAFRGRDGHLIGHCLNDRSSQVSLETLLTSCADSSEGDRLYQQWRVHEESQWVRRIGKAYRQIFHNAVAHGVMPYIEPQLQQALPCPIRQFDGQLQAPIASHVVEILEAYGFSDNIQLPITRRVHLSRDLERLLLLEAYWLVARGDAPLLFADRGLRYSVVHFYESHQQHFEERARIALNRLWRLLKHQEAD
ncbi:CRISPR-associated endonuclease Cas1 [Candidatus Thiothrix anitrata]|jgi:hypothetical protein|uniref:CRISPR-associated endonuclease Cas1 n=1 Tax=Candidatus Thiothrix anitrata TaxID=2823902 RepID=A0ABX7WYT7_9GAMM|nr:CRISPR-associated endonuclease Cas1 [Candidatus Thiothrix anitrata]QTR48561.1 CRISPR-associated endonuclease Cas1 [Candidatus Thiothrix anitrata]